MLIGRIGCYLFGCDYGRPLSDAAPRWLAQLGTFPKWPSGTLLAGAGAPAWRDHVAFRGLPLDAAASLPVHPTQLYESAAGGLLLALCLATRRRQRFTGQTFLSVVFGYAALRFALELLRDDPERGAMGPGLAVGSLAALGLSVLLVAFAAGPLRSLVSKRWRRHCLSAIGLAVLGVTAYGIAAASGPPRQASTSQWIGIAVALVVAAAWWVREQRLETQAPPHPSSI